MALSSFLSVLLFGSVACAATDSTHRALAGLQLDYWTGNYLGTEPSNLRCRRLVYSVAQSSVLNAVCSSVNTDLPPPAAYWILAESVEAVSDSNELASEPSAQLD